MKPIFRTSTVLICLLIISNNIYSQITFQKNYGDSGDEVANWVANTATGYIIAGNSTSNNNQDGFLLNLDFSGQVIWQKKFGGSGTDRLNVVHETPEGFIVAGETNSYGAGGFDAWLLKISHAGNIIWSKTYGEASRDEAGLGLVLVSGNRLLLSGTTTPIGTTGYNSYFHLLDDSGQNIWSNRVESGSIGNLLRSNYVDSGVIYAGGSAEQDGAYLQLDLETGDFIGGRRFPGSNTEALYYQQRTVDGNLLLSDHTWSAFSGNQMALWVQKVTPVGQTIWSRVYRQPNSNLRGRVEAVEDDNYLLTPYSSPLNANSDAMLVKINDLGIIEWARNYGQPGQDWLYKSQLATDGGYISVGGIMNASGNLDVLVIKTDEQGLIQGCCVPSANILVQGYTHSNLSFVFTQSPWVQDDSTTVQQTTPNFQVSDYCTSLPTDTTFDVALCPNEPFTYNGIDYFAPDTFAVILTSQSGCDSTVQFNLQLLPHVEVFNDIALCPNEPFTYKGIDYFAPGTVSDTLTNQFGCDSIIHFGLLLLPDSEVFNDIALCPNEPFTLNGLDYFAPGTVTDSLIGEFGCDSIIHYNLLLLPQPTRAENIQFCPGDTVVIAGQSYTQPGTVVITIPAATGCDTLVTYTLSSLLPAPSVVAIQCPIDISVIVDPGMAPTEINYNMPTATSNCPCPGLTLTLTSGLASGALFPNGITQVCYNAEDACGNSKTCCFKVTVREVQPCDIKVIGCMRYELLSITADAIQRKTYRIKVTNNCANKMTYTAIQLPNAVVAAAPANASVFTADSGRKYDVRNPNYSPFYSIRFKSILDSIANGQSDIFEYTLPPQSAPDYIHITTRLEPQLFFEAHLNTFYCPIGITPSGNRSEERILENQGQITLFPNPSDGTFWVDLGKGTGKGLKYRIFNSQGQQVLANSGDVAEELLRINLPNGIPDGLYFFELLQDNGEKETLRFVLQR